MVKAAVFSMIVIAALVFAPASAHGQGLTIYGYYGNPYYSSGYYSYPYYSYPYYSYPYYYPYGSLYGYPYSVFSGPSVGFGFTFGHGHGNNYNYGRYYEGSHFQRGPGFSHGHGGHGGHGGGRHR